MAATRACRLLCIYICVYTYSIFNSSVRIPITHRDWASFWDERSWNCACTGARGSAAGAGPAARCHMSTVAGGAQLALPTSAHLRLLDGPHILEEPLKAVLVSEDAARDLAVRERLTLLLAKDDRHQRPRGHGRRRPRPLRDRRREKSSSHICERCRTRPLL
jgi:hypothetical protein